MSTFSHLHALDCVRYVLASMIIEVALGAQRLEHIGARPRDGEANDARVAAEDGFVGASVVASSEVSGFGIVVPSYLTITTWFKTHVGFERMFQRE